MTVDAGRPALTGGRDMTTAVGTFAWAVAVLSGSVGLLLVGLSVMHLHFSPWHSGTLTPGLVGAGMLGVAPGLLLVTRSFQWEEVRTLVFPTAVVVLGLSATALLNGSTLSFHGGSDVLVSLFSLGWVAVLVLMAVASVVVVVTQYGEPRLPDSARLAPLPGWAKPLIAVLGSALFGLGVGLLIAPGFWGALLPFHASRMDAQSLGVFALAFGVGILGALAEDDLARVRPALVAVIGVGVLALVVLAAHASDIRWASGPGVAMVALVAGLVVTGGVGQVLWRRRTVS